MRRLKVTIWDNDQNERYNPVETIEIEVASSAAEVITIPVFHLRDGIVTVSIDSEVTDENEGSVQVREVN